MCNITRELVDEILAVVPEGAKCCYTGQSALAYCPDPTFTYDELNCWPTETDIDLFCYNQYAQASIVQAYMDAGYQPSTSIERFKADRIRFYEPSRKYSLQTVKLDKEGYPQVNVSWRKNCSDALDVIQNFDMDYLCVSMDLSKKTWCDLRGADHRVAHVNKYNGKFDPTEADAAYWYRQFERCPKGWERGIDTRPVARQYLQWIEQTIEFGDKGAESATRKYADLAMHEACKVMIESGISEEQAHAIYHMARGEEYTWEAVLMKHKSMHEKISAWLKSVEDC